MEIQKRLCSSCGIYFGSIKSLNKHKRFCNSNQVEEEVVIRRVRPTRIAARRQRELLCVMAMQEMEWHSIDDVDAVGQDEELVEFVEDIGTPVLEDVNPIWVNEEDE